MTTVMVVDDHDRLRAVLRDLLAGEGHRVIEAVDGFDALRKLDADGDRVDLILLDLVMPNVNGMHLLTTLRDLGRTVPVIVLSAVGDVAARVQALDLGAVDYVGKPFNPSELLARVRRHLSRSPAAPSWASRFLAAGGVELDLDRRRARVAQGWVDLTDRETRLLAHLMRREGHVCARDELLHDVWGLDFDPGSNVIEVCVRRLRAKLPDVPIQTVRSVGYSFDGA